MEWLSQLQTSAPAAYLTGLADAVTHLLGHDPTRSILFYELLFLLLILFFDLRKREWIFGWPSRMVRGVGSNLSLLLANGLLFAPLVYAIATPVQTAYDALGIYHIDNSFWETTPYWLLVIIALLSVDFADYWNHRFMHMKWLWPFHAIHHSDPDVTATTTFRVHFLEAVFMTISYTLLLSWLGMPANILGLGAVLITIHNMYVHVNIDWTHGPFRYLLASPRFHRWHHADAPRAYGKNLANIFPFYDVIFGTYYVPGPCNEKVGIDEELENNLLSLIIWPFLSWGRMLADKWAARPAWMKGGHHGRRNNGREGGRDNEEVHVSQGGSI